MFHQDLKTEMLKDVIATSPTNDVSNSVVQPFHDTTGDSIVEVVEEL
jgi:hypothetical protein